MLFILQEIIYVLLVSHEVFEPNGRYMQKMDCDIHEGFADPNLTATLKTLQQLLANLTRHIFHIFAVLLKHFLSTVLGISSSHLPHRPLY
jgi:hypothetical protein